MKKILFFGLVLVTLVACKNNSKTEDQSVAKEEHSVVNSTEKSILETGCYHYNNNGNSVEMEVTEVSQKVKAKLNIAYAEKDASQGTFVGSLNGSKLIGVYTFKAEGTESSREMAFLIKNNQIIEGYGELNEDGTKFKDTTSIKFTSKTPLIKVDCTK